MRKIILLVFLHSFILGAQVDLQIDSIFHRSHINSFLTEGITYYQMPANEDSDIYFSAVVSNQGPSDATNVVLEVEATNGLQSIYFPSDTLSSLAAGTVDSLFILQAFNNSWQGNYFLKYTVTHDSLDAFMANNKDSVQLKGSEVQYARHNGVQNGTFNISDIDSNTYELGQIVEFEEAVTLVGGEVYVDSSNTELSFLYFYVFKYNPLDSAFDFVTISPDLIVTESSLGIWATLCFYDPVYAEPGESYLFVLGDYDTGFNVGKGQLTEKGSYYYYNHQTQQFVPIIEDSYAPMMNLIKHEYYRICSLNLEENYGSKIEIFPNPARGQVNIEFVDTQPDSFLIHLLDASGKLVLSHNYQPEAGGTSTYSIDVELLNNGVYTMIVQGKHSVHTKRVILNN